MADAYVYFKLHLTPSSLPGAYAYNFNLNRANNTSIKSQPFIFTGNRSPSQHARSFTYFLGYYGLLFTAAFAACIFWIRYKIHSTTSSKKTTSPAIELPNNTPPQYLTLFLFFCATLPLAFFYVDFIYDAVLPWIKYRLIEIPFLGILIILLLHLIHSCTPRTQYIISATLLLWSIPAFLMHEPGRQLLSNIEWFLNICR